MDAACTRASVSKALPGCRFPVKLLPDYALAAVLILALVLTACGTPREPRREAAALLYSAAFGGIAAAYIEETELQPLIVAGLKRLSRFEPLLAAERNEERVRITLAGEEISDIVVLNGPYAALWGGVMEEVFRDLRGRSDRLKNLSQAELEDAFLEGVFDQLDGLSRYNSSTDLRKRELETGTLGLRLRASDQGLQIAEVPEGSPAQAATLAEGDIVRSIDGKPLAGLTAAEAEDLLRGLRGSGVQLTVTRAEGRGREIVRAIRAEFKVEDARLRGLDDVAHLQLRGFTPSTADATKAKLDEAKRTIGDSMKGLVLDLRGNEGGLLDAAVAVADLFVEEGTLALARGRHPDSHQIFNATPGDRLEGAPLVVLIDGNTAGGASIVAAALQDRGRAVVIGSVSSGHGTIQTVLGLPNRSEIVLTWAAYFAPSGYSLEGRGVLPGVCTAEEGLEAEDVVARLRQGTLPIDRKIWQRKVSKADTSAIEYVREHCPARDVGAEIDLEVAVLLLGDPALYRLALGRPRNAGGDAVGAGSFASLFPENRRP